MLNLYIRDANLQLIGVMDNYKSLIWSKRWNDIGECEVYVMANQDTLQLMRRGYYITREDDDMICRIESVRITTDVESGNMIIATAKDMKAMLNQRVIWNVTTFVGTLGEYFWKLIRENAMSPTQSARYLPIEFVDAANLTDHIEEQVTYEALGDKIIELCNRFGYGWKVTLTNNNRFAVTFLKGTDRSGRTGSVSFVEFSPEYENLATSTYSADYSKYKNVALVAGEGEGSERRRNVRGFANGLDRYELMVDAKDISATVSYDDLVETYPDGHIEETSGPVYWTMDYINVPIIDSDQLEWLKKEYPNGQEITIDGVRYYQTYDARVAILDTSAGASTAQLLDIIYSTYLLSRGNEKLAENPAIESFEGSVEPDISFIYGRDYFLGDIVLVKNEYGMELPARVTEVLETYDADGYLITPTFSDMEV